MNIYEYESHSPKYPHHLEADEQAAWMIVKLATNPIYKKRLLEVVSDNVFTQVYPVYPNSPYNPSDTEVHIGPVTGTIQIINNKLGINKYVLTRQDNDDNPSPESIALARTQLTTMMKEHSLRSSGLVPVRLFEALLAFNV